MAAPLLVLLLQCALLSSARQLPPHKQPLFKFVSTIAYDPANNLRDPSAAIQDPATKRWHFWVDWMPADGPHGFGNGWHAKLKHFSASAITGPWTNHGFALNHSTDPTAADFAGQFSSSAIYDAGEKLWWLFYSASGANQTAMLTNSQMACSSSSPHGPWTRRGLAAWPTGSPATNWSEPVTATPDCGQKNYWNARFTDSRFTDSGRALIIGGRRAYWTKGVTNAPGLVASEGVYLPHTPNSFAPPYHEKPDSNPVYPPIGKHGEESGYENCEFFMGSKDGLLHIFCTWDGGTRGPAGLSQGVHPHFVVDLKQDPLGENWTYVGAIEVDRRGRPSNSTVPIAGEPTPVYEGGPPGDGASVRYFIAREDAVRTHGGPGSLRIGLFELVWITPVPLGPPPAPPPHGSSQTCPKGWTTHASGFWRNTDPCPDSRWAGCTPDAANHTAAKCAAKCTGTKGCVAIVVCFDTKNTVS